MAKNTDTVSSREQMLDISEAASGLTSIIKAVLTLEHKKIPPNIHIRKFNPNSMYLNAFLSTDNKHFFDSTVSGPRNQCAAGGCSLAS